MHPLPEGAVEPEFEATFEHHSLTLRAPRITLLGLGDMLRLANAPSLRVRAYIDEAEGHAVA